MKSAKRIAAAWVGSMTSVLALVPTMGAHGDERPIVKTNERLAAALEEVQKMVTAAGGEPGLTIGVTDRERLLGSVVHGYADLKTRKPATADTRFALGSISKSFTAVVLLQMADEGKFDPAAPLDRYLPGFRVKSRYPQITGRSVLNHTSGLPNYLPHLSSTRYVLYALHDFEPRYAPGEQFLYSNTGYQILGYAAERIDHESFASILERRILAPLGMHSTEPQMDDLARQSLATSYERWSLDDSQVEANWFPYLAADGQIATTTADFSAYVRFILNRGATPGGRILSPAAFQAFITPALDNYAYGVQISGSPGQTVVSHSGSVHGFNSYFEAHIDEGFGLTFMSNAALDWELMGRIIRIVSTALGGNGQPASNELFGRAPAQELDGTSRYAGTYRGQDGASTIFSSDKSGALFLERPDGTRTQLTKLGHGIYGSRKTGAYLFFDDPEHPERGAQEVSNGAQWYAKEGSEASQRHTVPAEYRAYVGRYRNHSNEGPDMRVFVRRGRLMVASAGSSSGSELEAVAPGLFRPADEPHSPDWYRFDSLDDGVTLRLQETGVPLYRIDMP